MKNEKIGIVGSGLIGKSWAMIFASEGFNVKLYDVDKNQVAKAIEVIIFINYSPPHTTYNPTFAVYTHSFVLIRVSDLLTITSDL